MSPCLLLSVSGAPGATIVTCPLQYQYIKTYDISQLVSIIPNTHTHFTLIASPSATMVKNLSRKSSTVFHNPARDPLPPLPIHDLPLHAGFHTSLPLSSANEELHYLRQRLESLSSRDTEADVPEPQSAAKTNYLRQLELVHKQSQQCLRLEQQKLEAMMRADVQRSDAGRRAVETTRKELSREQDAARYCKPFCDFMTENPTVFHAVDAFSASLDNKGFKKLSERDSWKIERGGKYYVERNGSALIAFAVGDEYEPGNGAAVLAGHIDALTVKLKPVSKVPDKAGFIQLGVAPYASGLNKTWWDRDLGVGGRVLVKEGNKIVTKLVQLNWPIAKVPSLAEHFGAPAAGPFNLETQMVPIIGLEASKNDAPAAAKGTFAATQPPRLVKAIAKELGMSDCSKIVNWELELFDTEPAKVIGLDKEFISACRIDDKLCSWAALEALINSTSSNASSSILKVVGLFDDEEIGSYLRQGARGNFLPSVMERAVGSLAGHDANSNIMGQTYANSFLVSSDVCHAVNPNFMEVYLANHAPKLNVGVAVSFDSNAHMTTDSVSAAVFQQCADRVGAELQVFQIRNDSRSGGTVGPMLSAATGMRSIDAGIPQLSMHSIRATTGSLDPGLGVQIFQGFLDEYESVDAEFR